ncbi:MAG: hypothetical protein EPO11_08265 [Gammaproteobacteria bacterium]|nr:MAG: hypothetical protein EPO11_08265 [Gammaproteobacteria bacterium]
MADQNDDLLHTFQQPLEKCTLELEKANISSPDNIEFLKKNASLTQEISRILEELNKANLLNQTNLKLVMNNVIMFKDMQQVLTELNNASMLNETTFLFIAKKYGVIYEVLYNAVSKDTKEDYHIIKIIQALCLLDSAYLLSENNLWLVKNNSDYIENIANLLDKVNNLTTLNDNIVKLIMDHAPYADRLIRVIDLLADIPETKMTMEEHLTFLTMHIQDINELYPALMDLKEVGLLIQENYDILISNTKQARAISHIIIDLQQFREGKEIIYSTKKRDILKMVAGKAAEKYVTSGAPDYAVKRDELIKIIRLINDVKGLQDYKELHLRKGKSFFGLVGYSEKDKVNAIDSLITLLIEEMKYGSSKNTAAFLADKRKLKILQHGMLKTFTNDAMVYLRDKST